MSLDLDRASNASSSRIETYRVFVATWNVGGKSPHNGLNLDDFLQVQDQFDIVYVLGFQEIVPLNAGNVLAIEDNGPAAKWLSIISRSLNHGYPSPLINQTTSLKTASRIFRAQSTESDPEDFMEQVNDIGPDSFVVPESNPSSGSNMIKYSLIACKQMVGIFLTIWVRKELVHHLASGEKEGDELRRNSDVIEIIKNAHRIIWLGDLNYRIALSYAETRKFVERTTGMHFSIRISVVLKIEREAGRVFNGWKEGKIYFAPTYKYYNNSDAYAGEIEKSKSKRRTPAWYVCLFISEPQIHTH
ncbi:hypothetical protein C3L33_02241, partial [Rhododendron williamsianum]